MTQRVDAVFENGVLRPLAEVSLAESQRVTLTISDADSSQTNPARQDDFLERLRAELATLEHLPTLEEVQQALSKIPGSMEEDFDAEREERC